MSNTQGRPVIMNVVAQANGVILVTYANGSIQEVNTGFDLTNYGGLPYLPEIAMMALLVRQQLQIAELQKEIDTLKAR